MKIWCCLCFTVRDEPEEEVMKEEEGDLVNKENSEGVVMENNEVAEEEEAEPRLEVVAAGHDEHLRMLEGMVHEMRGGTHWDESVCVGALDTLRAAIRTTRWSEGETSSGPPAAMEDGDHDFHHKRAKLHSFSNDFYYTMAMSSGAGNSSSSDKDYSRNQGSNVLYKSGAFYHSLVPNNGGEENPFESGSGKDDERDNGDTSNTEDFEVRMDLTYDLLHMVFSFLDHINLCRAAIVCRQWRAASAHEDFWRCLNFENRNISVEQFEDICWRYPNATELNISGTPAIPMLVMTAITSLRNLEVLTLGKGPIGDLFFHSLADCQMLRSLIVNDATLGTGIQEIHINHDRLRHLELTKCRVMRISIRCPQLETLSMKRSNMAQAVLNSPLLRDLDLGSCHKLSDAVIRSAATSCPQLESLDMSNCSCVSDETLREIAGSCVNLHVLNASYCPNVSLESVRLPLLTVLKLHSCEGITSASMVAIAYSSMLEVLELDNCSLLTSVILELPRLQNIRLVHCRKFADLNLRTLMLSSIMVSNCPVLHRISITSNSLQKLSLQKQESLTTLSLQCPSLQEVDLTDCESLTISICNVFSDGGGCPMLKSLVLENCESLTAVRFCSTSLVSLSLVGCRGITSLELICPYLEQVSLDGCDHLERAALFPVGLRSLNLGICPKLSALSIDAPTMVLLELKGCGVLSEASINCPLLTSLDASFCSQLRDDCLSATAASCPLIESLILMSCPSVGSDGLYSLRWLPNLIVLDLSYTFLMSLKPVFESCTKLKVLKLQACKYLSDSSLEPLYKEGALPALQELDLSYGTLCQSAIEELLSFCTHLTHVSLNGCVNMHDLNWGSSVRQPPVTPSIVPSGMFSLEYVHDPVECGNRLLQNLNCVGCPNIRKVHIPVAAGCLHLTSLNLSLSANLKDVEVACFNLCFLNLSNCYSLEVLKLDCPKLTSLFLQSCNMDEAAVEAAISNCTMLETLDVRFCPKICPLSMGRLRAACPSLKRIFSSLSPQS
ncbi:PREDICTED: F-box/LRR-repeat protein 15 [Fragaria vesca subsp. vesca]|uniref:F-box/LRR-repeat protein 15 n=1 Tax=Fragaria vesca subsp. vesca TaxID=101020 RepID=UPI0002C377E0|nr:PREDICTED: F-box/LRR-repeat protein 15 [Fragaria vesca subsp. vesca]